MHFPSAGLNDPQIGNLMPAFSSAREEVVFLNELDAMSSPKKVKGVGEFRICGVGAAIANAVANATGVRDGPITLDKLVPRMPRLGT